MSRKYRNRRSNQRWHWCYALVLRALSSRPIMSGLGLRPCLGRHFYVQKMVRNYRSSASRGTILCVTNGCQLRGRTPNVRWLLRLGTHTDLDWARRVYVDFGVGITAAVVKREFMDNRQADQASAEPRATPIRDSMSVRAAHEGDRAPVCPYLVCVSPHTSELSFRSGGQFWPRRQGRKHGGDGTVAMLGQYMLPVCWC